MRPIYALLLPLLLLLGCQNQGLPSLSSEEAPADSLLNPMPDYYGLSQILEQRSGQGQLQLWDSLCCTDEFEKRVLYELDSSTQSLVQGHCQRLLQQPILSDYLLPYTQHPKACAATNFFLHDWLVSTQLVFRFYDQRNHRLEYLEFFLIENTEKPYKLCYSDVFLYSKGCLLSTYWRHSLCYQLGLDPISLQADSSLIRRYALAEALRQQAEEQFWDQDPKAAWATFNQIETFFQNRELFSPTKWLILSQIHPHLFENHLAELRKSPEDFSPEDHKHSHWLAVNAYAYRHEVQELMQALEALKNWVGEDPLLKVRAESKQKHRGLRL